VKIKVLGSFGSEGPGQRPSAFLVDDRVLVDAGTVGGALSVAEQIEIQFALISHAHLDHTAGLAFLTDTLAMVAADRRVTACSIAPVVEALRTHAFNDALWPNFTNIPSAAQSVLGFRTLPEEAESRVGELWVTPVLVEHTVPTTGFVFSGDTGPTKRIWQIAREMRGLKALIVETAFPNRLAPLAKASGHLTPEMLGQEIAKMPADLPIWVYHIKPQLYQETAEELAKIDPTRIHILEQGKTYTL
jgi:cAMP phosphodiesterase